MRDLKHLIYFENLLQQANNDLVQDACKDGRLALAWNCSYIPEVLLDTDNCFGVRLRAPNCTNPDMATYYMTNRSCPYSKSILERAFEGGYNFISALIGQECCTTMNRMEQYFEYCELIPNDKFFCTYLDMPLRKTEWHAGYYRRQIEQKIIQPLEKVYGVDFSEEKLRKAVEQFNEVCRIITEMNEMRMADNPVITGYEFHVIQLCTLTCPKDLILPYLRETLQELRERKPDPKPWYRARILIAGSEIDDPEFTKMCEMAGGLVVADRYCFGSFPSRGDPARGGQGRSAVHRRLLYVAQPVPARHGPREHHRAQEIHLRSRGEIPRRRHHRREHEVLRILGLRARSGRHVVLRGL